MNQNKQLLPPLQNAPELPLKQQSSTFKPDKKKKWLTAAYKDFQGRLCLDYQVFKDNSFKFADFVQKMEMHKGVNSLLCCFFCPIKCCEGKMLEVPNCHFAMVVREADEGRKTELFGPGYHILKYYDTIQGVYSFYQHYPDNILESSVGDLKIAIVQQGQIMHLESGGNNIMLGPGVHRITEPMNFIQNVQLDSFYIEIGPEKWVTIPDGYDGISLNRGQINILQGGRQHHLKHIGDKFAKMVPKTLQTDRITSDVPGYVARLESGSLAEDTRSRSDPTEYLQTTTAEGSTVILDVMVFWKILDTMLAATTAMEILKVDSSADNTGSDAAIQSSGKTITTLRQNVLRMCKSHMTALVGSCSLAGEQAIQADIKKKRVPGQEENYDRDDISEEANREQEDLEDYNPPLEQDNLLSSQDDSSNQGVQKHQKIAFIQPKSKSQEINFQDQSPVKKQKQQKRGRKPNAEKNTFDILSFLQNQAESLSDVINEDLGKIGCFLDNICIYSVSPTDTIQQELNKQTKAKVDSNTAIIQALSRRQVQEIEQQISTHVNLKKAQSNSEVLKMRTQAQADAQAIVAQGEAESIRMIAKARKEEAQNFEAVQIACDLAQIRTAGEAGEKIFQGTSNNFVFGQNPGDVLHNMVSGFDQGSQKNNRV